MMLALLWLTLSLPFVFKAQQELAKKYSISSNLPVTEEESNPFSSTTEEKAPSSTSFSEEYLHDCHISHHVSAILMAMHILQNDGTYHAYHGELDVPPPDVA